MIVRFFFILIKCSIFKENQRDLQFNSVYKQKNCCIDGQKKYLDANKLLMSLINWKKDTDLGKVLVEMQNCFSEDSPYYLKQKYIQDVQYGKYFLMLDKKLHKKK